MSAALVNRSLSTLKTELEFLRDSEVISEDFYNQVVGKLPDRYRTGAPPIEFTPSASSVQPELPAVQAEPLSVPLSQMSTNSSFRPLEQSTQSLQTTSTYADVEIVEALYDYRPQQVEDLELHMGDKVRVLEHTSSDWWRGSVNGGEGMFPSNYVRKASTKERDAVAPPYEQSYGPYPQQQQQQQQQAQGYYQQQSVQMVQQPNQSPQVQMETQQVQVQQQGGHGHLRKFGSKLGNAAIFGAGATIGSDIVNSIF